MMEHKFEATDYIYSNAGQLNPIEKQVGIDAKMGKGDIHLHNGITR